MPPPAPRADGLWRRALDALADRQSWRVVALLAAKLPVALALFVAVALAPLALAVELLVLGMRGDRRRSAGRLRRAPARSTPSPACCLCLLALRHGVLAVAVLERAARRAAAASTARAARPAQRAQPGPIREMLAESLGDRSLSIAYWLPDREAFVDDAGRPVALPEPGSGRAWTAVERDGRRVAAIVHDAELDTGPELVQAAAAAARAGARQRAPEGRPARARRGPARLARAHRRGRPTPRAAGWSATCTTARSSSS